ncbi:MAG: ABC transporter ATP-binding protein [Reyranella sp.]|uniref:ABC transporter ATP-binding protein n=1 Tax=Reyranella sp. TaxID=1929291 RepID=UPI001211563E|nr:ABC transporter ATP-binding protein [Reyranella sp.]TAJ86460.1 MAG: ABC transporter ATP-binding protein [Reyranella sp.]
MSSPAIAVRGLVCRRDHAVVLDGIDLAFGAGEVTAIVGPNGAGKTTLLRHLAGLDTPAAGQVDLRGQPLASLGPAIRAWSIAYLPQAASAYWPLRARDLVALGRLPHGADLSRPTRASDAEAVQRALERVDGVRLADRAINTLSQGERARLMMARALATEAPIFLADEPVASLDPAYALETMTILRAEAARGACVIVVLHDLGLAARFADRIVVLANHKIAADGPPDVALAAGVIDAAYGVTFRHITVDGVPQPVAWEKQR